MKRKKRERWAKEGREEDVVMMRKTGKDNQEDREKKDKEGKAG